MSQARTLNTWETLAELELTIEDYALDPLTASVSSNFERKTTVIRLRGGTLGGTGSKTPASGSSAGPAEAARTAAPPWVASPPIGSDSAAEGAFFGVTEKGAPVFTRIPRFEMRAPTAPA